MAQVKEHQNIVGSQLGQVLDAVNEISEMLRSQKKNQAVLVSVIAL